MANPKPGLDVIYLPCRKCGGKREHFGSGVCWECMGPAERVRLAHEPEPIVADTPAGNRMLPEGGL